MTSWVWIGTKAIIETGLKCKGRGVQIDVKGGEVIPKCPTKCGVNTHWKLK